MNASLAGQPELKPAMDMEPGAPGEPESSKAADSPANNAAGFNRYYYWQFGQNASSVAILCVIVVGNVSILCRLKSWRRRRSNVNYFIAHLAIADLLVGFFSLSLDSILRHLKAFPFGLHMCLASKYISTLFIYSSTYLLVALSFDRWEAVVRPLAFTQNRSRGHLLVVGAWLLAMLFAIPGTVWTEIKTIDGLPQCWMTMDPFQWKLFMVYLTLSLLVVPVILIGICYVHIAYTIWRKGRLATARAERQAQRRTIAIKSSLEIAQQHGGDVIPKARIKTIKMTFVIVAAFILCWAPFYIINLCAVFRLLPEHTTWSVALKTLSQSLAHLNSAVNPIIYWIFSSKRNSISANKSSSLQSQSQRSSKSAQTRPIIDSFQLAANNLLAPLVRLCITRQSPGEACGPAPQ